MQLSFKKSSTGFNSYEAGTIYFDSSAHVLRVGTGENTFDDYTGVRSAGWNSETKVLTIVNQEGTNIVLDFADVASAEGVNSLLKTLRDDINDLSTNLAGKLAAPATAGEAGQVLKLDENGNTIWAGLPAATDYTVHLDSSTGGSGDAFVKRYTIKQGAQGAATTIGTIDIPKDLVVTSGSVVAGTWAGDPEEFTESAQGAGQAIKLVIANQTDPLYINVGKLVDLYTAEQNATQVQIVVSNNNEISATIVAGSIGATELDSSVNASLAKADSALQAADVSSGTTNGAISVKGTAVSVYGLGSAAYEASTAFATAAQGTLAASAIQSVSGETAVTDSSYIAVSVEASTNTETKAVTLSSHANVTTQDVSTAVANSADGLALASNVKAYVDFKSGLKEWAQFN